MSKRTLPDVLYRVMTKAVVLAQLAERSLQIPEVFGLSPVFGKKMIMDIVTVDR